MEADISNKLNISRAPVREALRQLTVEGMVISVPRKGCHVVDMTLEETLEVFEIRIALEKQVLEILVKRNHLKNEDYYNLEQNIEKMRRYENDILQEHEMVFLLTSLDLQFHNYLWDTSCSFQRSIILNRLFYQLLLVMNRNVGSLGTFSKKAEEHKRIINALKTNDLTLAIEEFDRHMKIYINSLSSIFQ